MCLHHIPVLPFSYDSDIVGRVLVLCQDPLLTIACAVIGLGMRLTKLFQCGIPCT